MKGWHKESHRHYLAAKGIKTAKKGLFVPATIDFHQRKRKLKTPEIRVWFRGKGDADYKTFNSFEEAKMFIKLNSNAEKVPLVAVDGYEINIFDMKERKYLAAKYKVSDDKWFKPGKSTGWSKEQKQSTRLKKLMDSTDKRKTKHKRYIEAGRRSQALANVTTDVKTEALARKDAQVLFKKARDDKEYYSGVAAATAIIPVAATALNTLQGGRSSRKLDKKRFKVERRNIAADNIRADRIANAQIRQIHTQTNIMREQNPKPPLTGKDIHWFD